MDDTRIQLSDLHPRYWGTWLGIGLLWLLVRLPHRLQLYLGKLLGQLLYAFASKRRRIARTNIRLCFPELSASEQEKLVKQAFLSYGMNIFETATAWLRGAEHLRIYADIRGVEHIQNAQAQGKGVLIIGAHFSTIDISGALVFPHLQMDVIYRPSSNPVFDRLIRKGRGRSFGSVINKQDTRAVIRGLRDGHAIWYAADQNYSRQHSVFAPFFGIPASTIRGTSRLVSMTGAAAVFCSHFRLDDGNRYLVEFSPVLENFPGADEVEDATRINRLIEEKIRIHPEQYLWLHRRFKTRPENEPSLY